MIIKKNICFPFVGDSIGGSYISSLNLIDKIDKKKFNVFIVLHRKGKFYEYLKKRNIVFSFIKINNFPSESSKVFKSLYLLIYNFFLIRNFLNKNKIKIVHGNDLRINLAWSFASIFLSKYIWHQRNFFNKRSLIQWNIFFFSNKIVSNSKTVFNSLPQKLKKKTVVIYNPISKIIVKKKIIEKTNQINIAFIGSDKNIKGFDIFKKLSLILNNKKYHLNFYGKKLNKNSCSFTQIKFRGFVKIDKILEQNDILVAPSKREGFGRSLLEFALNQKTVIASNILAHKEISSRFAQISVANNLFDYVKYIKLKKPSKLLKTNFAKLTPEYHANQIMEIYNKC